MFINYITWTWISIVFILLAYIFHTYKQLLFKSKTKKLVKTTVLPPGPKGIPILGNLPMLGPLPHRDLDRLSKQYGPIMYLRLGFVPTIVASSPQAAEQFLKNHDINFASRPFIEVAKHISYDRKGLSFAEYGSYWRNIRKLCTLELLSNHKTGSFKPMRKEELALFIKSIKNDAKERVIVDISAKISSLSADMSCLMVLGKKYIENEQDQKGFLAMVYEGMRLATHPNMADYIPYVGLLDLQGLEKRMKIVSKFFDEILEKVIDEHASAEDKGNHKDFVDVMLSIMESKDSDFLIDRSHIKAVVMDMLGGSMDTSATAIDWALSELIKNPRTMRKAQEELERVVGMDRMVEESDLANLEYLEMVIKEALRLHPVAPLSLPRESMEDCTVNGFYIPKKSRIIVNVWTIGRDPESWTDPEKFIPERFVDNNVDLRGHDFQFLPFGSGRRGCPGMQLALTTIRLVLGQLVHCFDWELPNNMLSTELDMTEVFGLTTPRAKHLLAIPTYRLHK